MDTEAILKTKVRFEGAAKQLDSIEQTAIRNHMALMAESGSSRSAIGAWLDGYAHEHFGHHLPLCVSADGVFFEDFPCSIVGEGEV